MEPGQPAAALSEDEADPFAALKMVAVFKVIALKVPAIWTCAWDEEAGMWRCGGDDGDLATDTGTLWVDVDVIELDGRFLLGTPERAAALDSLAVDFAEGKKQAGELGEDEADVVDSVWGKAIRYWRPFETEHGRFREHRWHVLSLVVSKLVVTHYSLVLTAATADRPAWRRLVETMDREIRAAEFASVLQADNPAALPPRPMN